MDQLGQIVHTQVVLKGMVDQAFYDYGLVIQVWRIGHCHSNFWKIRSSLFHTVSFPHWGHQTLTSEQVDSARDRVNAALEKVSKGSWHGKSYMFIQSGLRI